MSGTHWVGSRRTPDEGDCRGDCWRSGSSALAASANVGASVPDTAVPADGPELRLRPRLVTGHAVRPDVLQHPDRVRA